MVHFLNHNQTIKSFYSNLIQYLNIFFQFTFQLFPQFFTKLKPKITFINLISANRTNNLIFLDKSIFNLDLNLTNEKQRTLSKFWTDRPS